MTVAALTSTRSTMIDVAKKVDPDGRIAKIAEVLNQASPAFQDAPYLPSNSQMGNRVTLRSSLPTVDFVRINQGIAASKSTARQVVDTIGIMCGKSEVDVKMRHTVKDFNAYRMDEDMTFLEALAQKAETTIFTGNEATNEASFTGFAPRYASKSTTIGNAGYQIVDGAGTGTDNESIWVVDWGERACHLIYPEGSMAGINHRDLGDEVQVADADGNYFSAAVSEFELTFGLTVKNLRHVCRIANIDKSDLAGATPPNLVKLLIEAMHKMVQPMGANRVIYVSPNVAVRLEQQASGVTSTSGRAISLMDWQGVATPSFRGSPIRVTDALGSDEARIT